MKTLLIGASLNPERYAYQAVHLLVEKNQEVIPFGLKEGSIAGLSIITEKKAFKAIHTVTLYVGPKHQKEYYDYILSLNPQRVIFNPGTENKDFEDTLKRQGIFSERACTLVLLRTNQYQS